MSWASVVHPEDLERVGRRVGRSRDEDRIRPRVPLRGGGRLGRWVWCRAVELGDEAGEITGYLGTCSDTVVSPTVDRALEEAETASPTRSKRRRSAWRWSASTAGSCA